MNQANNIQTPWGPWQTAGFGLVVLVAALIGHTLAAIAYGVSKALSNPGADLNALAENVAGDGTLLSFTILAGSLIGLALTVFFAWLRSRGDIKSYLGFLPVSQQFLFTCLGAIALLVVIADSTSYFLERPLVPEFMVSAYRSVTFKPLIWFAVCIAAPLFEELFFRGFLIRGWERSKLGPVGSVMLSSLIWTGIHVQYGWYELTQILILGLMFGYMRVKTGSTAPSFACHVFTNIIATGEVAVVVSRGI